MDFSVAGQRILITGASSGIGAALARQLAAQQAVVGLIARRCDRLDEVLADCGKDSPNSMRCIDVLEPDEVEAVMRVNFFAPMRLTLALLPRMLDRGSGMVVNVSSVGGRLGIIHETAYCASKFALCGWSEALAVDLYGTGVTVKLIEPGPVDTEIWDRPGSEEPLYQGPKVSAGVVADGIIAALGTDRFEHYVPDMKAVVDVKNADIDTFIAGVAGMAALEKR
jgi:short-subunit dehydrogenase